MMIQIGKKLLLFRLAIFLTCSTFAENPIVQTNFSADPGSLVYQNRFYVYSGRDQASESGRWFNMREWRVYSSADMLNWTDHGPRLKPTDFSWSNGDAWAGQCVYRNGKFYWYVSCSHREKGGKAIGVAVSDNPIGPFVDARGSALITTDMTPRQGDFDDIDPTVFVDDDGQAYMYWGNGKCKYVKLNNDMISTSDSIHYAVVPKFGEAPWLHKYNGLYYLSYSSSLPSTIEYCTSNSPVGPWTYRGRILEPVKGCQTSHQAITEFHGKWYLVYHNGTLPGGNNFRRSICVEEFKYNPDGTISLIYPSQEGVLNPQICFSPFQKVEAETMAWSVGLSTVEDSSGGISLSDIGNGDYLKLRQVDFGKNKAKRFYASVASVLSDNFIEIRIDTLDGKLLGTCKVNETGSLTKWIDNTCNLKSAKGIHDLYLIFRGGAEKDLLHLDWWMIQ